MMGSGKTTVGRIIANQLELPFVDIDRRIEVKLGRPIKQLFDLYGEETFRCHESRVLEDITAERSVLSTGGGIVLADRNWDIMSRLGTTVFLDSSLDSLMTRLETAKKRRPLLECDDWREKLAGIREKRLALYQKADVTVAINTEHLDQVAEKVLEAAPEPW